MLIRYNFQQKSHIGCYSAFIHPLKVDKPKMTSIRPRLNRTHKGRNDDFHLVIQIIRHRRKREINTPYRMYEDELDPDTDLMLHSKKHSRQSETIAEVNRHIEWVVNELEMLADALQARKGDAYTAADLADAYRRRSDMTRMFIYADAVISKLNSEGHDGTAANYASAFRSFENYLGHRNLAFSEFTGDVVDRFVRHLRQRGNKHNTIVFYLKQLRVIYNRALREYVVKEDLKPFRNQSLQEEKTEKLAIARKDLQHIADVNLRSFNYYGVLARDLFMFSFYARGMAFADMCRLTRENIQGHYLCYRRKKTDQTLRIYMEKPLRELLARYADSKSDYLLPMLRKDDSYRERRRIQHKLNKHIHALGSYLGLATPLKFYVARHTWATLARNAGVELSVISSSMGHTSEKTTRIYLADMDLRKLDQANRRVINLLK